MFVIETNLPHCYIVITVKFEQAFTCWLSLPYLRVAKNYSSFPEMPGMQTMGKKVNFRDVRIFAELFDFACSK